MHIESNMLELQLITLPDVDCKQGKKDAYSVGINTEVFTYMCMYQFKVFDH